ncbi:hypothetical protein L1887_18078 [Cichorium endivia]|nr:hypothetical protein L1887_18078 [Cichorium endivia]
MGRFIVHEESPDKPWKRSRLWCHAESLKVLKQKKDKGNLQGLALDMQMLEKEKLRVSFEVKTDALSKMDNLILLQLNYQLDSRQKKLVGSCSKDKRRVATSSRDRGYEESEIQMYYEFGTTSGLMERTLALGLYPIGSPKYLVMHE